MSSLSLKGCGLLEENPKDVWLKVREEQQAVVDYLNRVDTVTYEGPGFSISYRCKDRLWINSDGRTNMPSGEVYTAPIEDSVNGNIKFSYDSLYMGREVSGVELTVKDGKVVKWTDKGQDFLDYIFQSSARIFGEAAIGTNYHIQRPTKTSCLMKRWVALFIWLLGNPIRNVEEAIPLQYTGI